MREKRKKEKFIKLAELAESTKGRSECIQMEKILVKKVGSVENM